MNFWINVTFLPQCVSVLFQLRLHQKFQRSPTTKFCTVCTSNISLHYKKALYTNIQKKVVIWGSRKLYVLTVSYSFAHLSNNERKLYTVLTMKASTRTKAATRPQPQRTKHSAVVTTDESNDASRHSACSSVSKWLVLKTRPMRLSTILSNKWW